ncbi:MAG: hypothetical protein ACK5JS_00605 [Mangrovibacterium sp.]
MSFIIGLLKFIFFFLLFIFIIGYFSLRKIRRKAQEELYRQQNPQNYQKQHEGEVEIEDNDMDSDGEFTDYEEIE